jgi:hypothetical protein
MRTMSFRRLFIVLLVWLRSVTSCSSTAAAIQQPITPRGSGAVGGHAITGGVAAGRRQAAGTAAAKVEAGPAPLVEEAWAVRYDGMVSSWDTAADLALDSAGNVYVTGTSAGVSTGDDIVTLKYDSLGNLIWERRYNGSGDGNDWAAVLTVDSAGNVHVAGSAWSSGTASDIITLKYDPDGNLLWDRYYNGPGDSNDSATALDVDVAGNVLVAGESGGDGTFNDFVTLKYDPDGNQLWARRYNGPGNGRDGATALVVDGAGNVYVTGLSAGTDAVRQLDYATLKYGSDGDLAWVKRLAGPPSENDTPHAIVLDDWGNFYVTGELGGYFDAPGDFGTVKYDSGGNQRTGKWPGYRFRIGHGWQRQRLRDRLLRGRRCQ